jgi:hypothetical protein
MNPVANLPGEVRNAGSRECFEAIRTKSFAKSSHDVTLRKQRYGAHCGKVTGSTNRRGSDGLLNRSGVISEYPPWGAPRRGRIECGRRSAEGFLQHSRCRCDRAGDAGRLGSRPDRAHRLVTSPSTGADTSPPVSKGIPGLVGVASDSRLDFAYHHSPSDPLGQDRSTASAGESGRESRADLGPGERRSSRADSLNGRRRGSAKEE